jgi:aminopeptidase N
MDQFKNTHKLRDTVIDTHHAEFIYDSISYYKGASIFKYLHSVIGNESYFTIIKQFLRKEKSHSNYNSFISNLVALSTEKERYTNIIEPFIDNRGLNNLICHMEEANGLIKEFCITQEPCTHATEDHYYSYEVDVLLVYDDREEIMEAVAIKNQKHCILEDLKGRTLPSAIILNSNDTAYFKQTFTVNTIDWLKKNTHVLM